jgi:hypothetical protein
MANIPVVATRGLLRENQNGVFFQPGRMYNLSRKFGAGQTYLRLWELSFSAIPAALELARELNVVWRYAAKVISEIHLHDEIIDPAEIRLGKNVQRGLESISHQRKTCSFSPSVLKSPIAPIWVIVVC